MFLLTNFHVLIQHYYVVVFLLQLFSKQFLFAHYILYVNINYLEDYLTYQQIVFYQYLYQ